VQKDTEDPLELGLGRSF